MLDQLELEEELSARSVYFEHIRLFQHSEPATWRRRVSTPATRTFASIPLLRCAAANFSESCSYVCPLVFTGRSSHLYACSLANLLGRPLARAHASEGLAMSPALNKP